MRRVVSLTVALVTLMASGCARNVSSAVAVVDLPPPPEMPAPFPENANYGFARAYLLRDEPVLATAMTDRPRAFILISKNDEGRAKRVCKTYLESLPAAESAATAPNEIIVKTFWALNTDTVPAGCEGLVAAYDYSKMLPLRSKYQLDTRHTYILAIDQNTRAFYIDVSSVGETKMRQALLTWFGVAHTGAIAGPGLKIAGDGLFDKLAAAYCAAPGATPAVATLATAGTTLIATVILNEVGRNLCKKANLSAV